MYRDFMHSFSKPLIELSPFLSFSFHNFDRELGTCKWYPGIPWEKYSWKILFRISSWSVGWYCWIFEKSDGTVELPNISAFHWNCLGRYPPWKLIWHWTITIFPWGSKYLLKQSLVKLLLNMVLRPNVSQNGLACHDRSQNKLAHSMAMMVTSQ